MLQLVEQRHRHRERSEHTHTSHIFPFPLTPIPRLPSPVSQVKIAFRLPDGATLKQTYAASSTLQSTTGDVQEVLGDNAAFRYLNTYPRKVFTAPDMEKTLGELNLGKSAMIEVELVAGAAIATEGGGSGGDGGIINQLIMAIIWLLSLLNPMRWLGPAPSNSNTHRAEVIPPYLFFSHIPLPLTTAAAGRHTRSCRCGLDQRVTCAAVTCI